jgi:PAS domain S-box-containing protein
MTDHTGPETAIGQDSQHAHERAERLELVLQATNEGHWDWDLTTDEVYFSPRWKEMLGYRDDELPNELDAFWSRVHPDDVTALELVHRLYIEGFSSDYELEFRLRHKDESYRWINTRGIAVRDAAGQALRIVGAHQDITDRKRAEQEIFRRDAILEAVRFAAERFLNEDISWSSGAPAVLERLGRATGVSRVYVFENYTGPDGETWSTNTHEWVARGVSPQIDNPRLKALSFDELRIERWRETFRRGEMLHGHVRDMPAHERPEFEIEGTLSYALVPIYVDGAWWGFFGLDAVDKERDFPASERDALTAAANTLGAAVSRSRAAETSAWLAAIVESSDDAIIGETLDGRITSWNQGAERLYGYRADEAIGRSIDMLLPPEDLPNRKEVFTAVARGEHLDHYETERIRKDGSRVAVAVSFSPVRNRAGEIIGAAAITRDITGRRRAEEALRRSQESLSTLMSNLPGMAYRSHPGPTWQVDFVSEGAFDLTGHPPAELADNPRFSFVDLIFPEDRAAARSGIEAAITEGRPFHVTYRIRTADGAEKWVADQGRAIRDAGTLVALEGIITDVTDRVQSRQMLEQRVTERTRELTTLLEVATSVASTLELQPLLRVILEQLQQVVDHTGAAIFLLEDDERLRLLDYRGPLTRTELKWIWPLAGAHHSREVIRSQKPVIIPDIRADAPLALAFRAKAMEDLGTVPGDISSWMGVPLILRERAIGVLAMDNSAVDAYTLRHAELALAFAAQAAVAIENARLFEQAQGKAALEERQRLARELHDSVSQALFGIGLGARTARTVIEQDPARAVAPLDYVLSLAEAGLAEMRALIFELRPEALQEEGLVAALEKQVAALKARYGIAVDADLGDIPAVPLHVEEAIYRIAQEAMHNTVKHARASRVELALGQDADGIRVLIADDGKGFDTSGSFPGHLGLRTMRERAERLGGTLTLTSVPGEGSRIEVRIPVAAEE